MNLTLELLNYDESAKLLTKIIQKIIDCFACPFLTTIPKINELQELHCSSCPLITVIPKIDELATLLLQLSVDHNYFRD